MPKSVIVLTLRTDSSEIGRIGDEILKKIICSKYFCDYGGNQPNLLVSVKNWRKNSCQRGVDEQEKILGEDCSEDNRGKQVDSDQNTRIFSVHYHQQAVTKNKMIFLRSPYVTFFVTPGKPSGNESRTEGPLVVLLDQVSSCFHSE